MERAVATGDPDDDHLVALLERADALVSYINERTHRAYTDAGAAPVRVEMPSLRDIVASPPDYLDDYVDLVERLRANPLVARDLLQMGELACFEFLIGGDAWRAPAFAHLFSAEHKGLILVALRCLGMIAGDQVRDALRGLVDLPTYSNGGVPDRRGESAPSRYGPRPQSSPSGQELPTLDGIDD